MDRRGILAIIVILCVVAAAAHFLGNSILSKILSKVLPTAKGAGETTPLLKSCVFPKFRKSIYAECACPEGTRDAVGSSIACSIVDKCNGRSSGVDEDGSCLCVSDFGPYSKTNCVCPVTHDGQDLGLGFLENCCGTHGKMNSKTATTCTCDEGWQGNGCATKSVHKYKPCTEICENNTHDADVTCGELVAGAQICLFTDENNSKTQCMINDLFVECERN